MENWHVGVSGFREQPQNADFSLRFFTAVS